MNVRHVGFNKFKTDRYKFWIDFIIQALLNLHQLATQQNDPQFCDYLESEFLEEQVNSIKEFADYVTQTKRNGPGLGEYLFERLSLD